MHFNRVGLRFTIQDFVFYCSLTVAAVSVLPSLHNHFLAEVIFSTISIKVMFSPKAPSGLFTFCWKQNKLFRFRKTFERKKPCFRLQFAITKICHKCISGTNVYLYKKE